MEQNQNIECCNEDESYSDNPKFFSWLIRSIEEKEGMTRIIMGLIFNQETALVVKLIKIKTTTKLDIM